MSIVTPFGAKHCPRCNTYKVPGAFYSNVSMTDGLSCWCKTCQKATVLEHDRVRREQKRQAERERYRNHRTHILAAAREYRLLHPGREADRQKRRRARKRGNGGSYTAQEWRDLCAKYDHLCLWCGERKPLTPDHIVPVSKGGTSYISNIQPLCVLCNSRKNAKTIDFRPCAEAT